MSVRIIPKRSGLPGWEVDIRFRLPTGERFRERRVSPFTTKRETEAWASACETHRWRELLKSPEQKELDRLRWVRSRLPTPMTWPEEKGVYFIHSDGRVKIGWARSVARRLRELQVAFAEPIALVAVAPGGPKEEGDFHFEFRTWRRSGEWFSLDEPLLERILQLRP